MSRSRRRLPFGVILTAAVVVVLIPTLTPDDWFPEDKTTRDLVLAGVMLAGFLGLRALRRIPRMLVERREGRGGAAAGRVIRATFYEEAIRNVAARGMVRSRAQSPREFMHRASPLLAERAVTFREITNAFEGVRYGEAGLPPEEEERLEALARTLLPDSGGQRK